jgi:hypothetical protein
MAEELPPSADHTPTRRTFVRDVLLLQWKLLLGNVHNVILIPLTLGAAALDLVFQSGPHGSRFYRALAWGRQAEEAIDLHGALDRFDEPKPDAERSVVFDNEAIAPAKGDPRSG